MGLVNWFISSNSIVFNLTQFYPTENKIENWKKEKERENMEVPLKRRDFTEENSLVKNIWEHIDWYGQTTRNTKSRNTHKEEQ